MNSFGKLVATIYAAGARLVVVDRSLGIDGDLPKDLRKEVRRHREELLEAFTGDPLAYPGYDARNALYQQALSYVDREILEHYGEHEQDQQGVWRVVPCLESEAAKERATKVLCKESVADALNRAWTGGDFEEFRKALKRYVRAGLDAAEGKIPAGEVALR